MSQIMVDFVSKSNIFGAENNAQNQKIRNLNLHVLSITAVCSKDQAGKHGNLPK